MVIIPNNLHLHVSLEEYVRICIKESQQMIEMLHEKATSAQVEHMLENYSSMIKIVVDTRQKILAGGGEIHSDCKKVLLDHGSDQDDLWGANWYPGDQRIEFEALINIRPRLGNRGILIQSEEIRQKVESITRMLLGDV